MHHPDRRALVKGIGRLAEELYTGLARPEDPNGPAADGLIVDSHAPLGARLDPLLDAYLLESQPIVATEATILLADIRGFTTLMASYPPPLMTSLLNRFFTAACDAVDRCGGQVDKFMGDSVMAVFGAPERHPDDLLRALSCAVCIQQAILELNQGHQARGEPALYIGIGISTGQVMAGSFGPPQHREYTVIGDAVNLAARIESFSLRGQVLISEAVHAHAGNFVEVGPANRVRPKGATQPIALYPLRAVHYLGRRLVPAVEPRKSPRVKVSLDALFRQVQAKRLAAEQFSGQVRDIGYFGLSAELPLALPNLSELAIELPPWASGPPAGELYARVLRTAPQGHSYRTSLEFTAIDTPAHRGVKELVDDRLWHR